VASVLEAGGAVMAAIVAAALLNLRYLAIGVSVAPALRGSGGGFGVQKGPTATSRAVAWPVVHRHGA
jgi:biotin transporter BioY